MYALVRINRCSEEYCMSNGIKYTCPDKVYSTYVVMAYMSRISCMRATTYDASISNMYVYLSICVYVTVNIKKPLIRIQKFWGTVHHTQQHHYMYVCAAYIPGDVVCYEYGAYYNTVARWYVNTFLGKHTTERFAIHPNKPSCYGTHITIRNPIDLLL